jgi:hypothetical protein
MSASKSKTLPSGDVFLDSPRIQRRSGECRAPNDGDAITLRILFGLSLAIACCASPVEAQKAENNAIGAADWSGDSIVVQGNRNSDRYRLPKQFRNGAAETTDHWRTMVKNDHSACHDVGPHGCPFQPNTIFTLKSDGSARAGYPGEGR